MPHAKDAKGRKVDSYRLFFFAFLSGLERAKRAGERQYWVAAKGRAVLIQRMDCNDRLFVCSWG